MSLRFAIIKHIKTVVGTEWEDVVYEYQEEKVFNELKLNFLRAIPAKKWYQRISTEDVETAFLKAWEKTVSDFKKVTIRIM